MTPKLTPLSTSIVAASVLLTASASVAIADNGGYGQPQGYGAPQGYGYGPGPNSGNMPPPRNYGPGPGSRQAYGPGPGYGNLTPGYRPYRGGNSWGPFGGNRGSGPSFSGPWNNRGGNSWGPFGGSNRDNFGDFNNPFRHRSPGSWFSPDKDRWGDNWDDMLNAPSRMGTMPGGWEAPSVSVPNPVDVGDEFSDAARDVPDQMRNLNRNYDY